MGLTFVVFAVYGVFAGSFVALRAKLAFASR
jgi:hypothetical protein